MTLTEAAAAPPSTAVFVVPSVASPACLFAEVVALGSTGCGVRWVSSFITGILRSPSAILADICAPWCVRSACFSSPPLQSASSSQVQAAAYIKLIISQRRFGRMLSLCYVLGWCLPRKTTGLLMLVLCCGAEGSNSSEAVRRQVIVAFRRGR